tara:strand:+ start:1739 stop:2368 length:630 start_codon:yes stop_codon:yes gene_type:complete
MINNFKLNLILLLAVTAFTVDIFKETKAQSNSSTVTNTTAPSASSTTTGGTSINYQTNSSFSNDVGFGPGLVCRTPSVNFNTGFANNDSENWTAIGNSGTFGDTLSASIGLVVPFGSGVMDSCKTVAKQIAFDKEISSQLSMIRACASLHKEGIKVDPEKFPLLSDCVIELGQPSIVENKKNVIVANLPSDIKAKKNKTIVKVPMLIKD